MGRVTSVGVGIAIGCFLAVVGLLVGGGRPVELEVAATVGSSTTSAPVLPVVVEPAWTDEGGARFESTVIVVDDFVVDGSSAVLDYRLVSLANAGGFFGGAHLPAVLPETWELVTTSGATIVEAADPPRQSQFSEPKPREGIADSIRFETDDGEALGEVATVRVTSWRIAVTAETIVEMSGVSGSSAELFDGTRILLQTVIEQSTGAIVDFDLERPAGTWRVAIDQGFGESTEFVGEGPGWGRASSTISGIGGSSGITGFQLVWSEPTAPDVVRVRASVVSWQPLEGGVTVWTRT
jgi:hypothetical protein